jgi:hypothetical protein
MRCQHEDAGFGQARRTVASVTPIFSAIATLEAWRSAAIAFAAASLAFTGRYPTPQPHAASASVPQPSHRNFAVGISACIVAVIGVAPIQAFRNAPGRCAEAVRDAPGPKGRRGDRRQGPPCTPANRFRRRSVQTVQCRRCGVTVWNFRYLPHTPPGPPCSWRRSPIKRLYRGRTSSPVRSREPINPKTVKRAERSIHLRRCHWALPRLFEHLQRRIDSVAQVQGSRRTASQPAAGDKFDFDASV